MSEGPNGETVYSEPQEAPPLTEHVPEPDGTPVTAIPSPDAPVATAVEKVSSFAHKT